MSRDELGDWMERQYRFSATAMLQSISATTLSKYRPHLGRTIVPARGSVLAATEIAAYDPNPDYFFHWLRDSSLVIDALRVLIEDKTLPEDALEYFTDFVGFSLNLCRLDGRDPVHRGDPNAKIDPKLLVHVRSAELMAEVVGDKVLGEVRFNPDGTFDTGEWSRPQNDGPALRALTVLRFWRLGLPQLRACAASMGRLLETDLDYTRAHWREPCYDLWEEAFGDHYYTRMVQCAALEDGAEIMAAAGDVKRAESCRTAAAEIRASLDAYYDADEGFYLAFFPDPQKCKAFGPRRRLDIAVVLGAVHADRIHGAHSIVDPRALATLARLEIVFASEYRINLTRPADCGPAMGRYPDDVYFTGGAYYFSTFGAAQFYFRLAEAIASGTPLPLSNANRPLLAAMIGEAPESLGDDAVHPHLRSRIAKAVFDRGCGFMAVARAYAPPSGELAEQFSQIDGARLRPGLSLGATPLSLPPAPVGSQQVAP